MWKSIPYLIMSLFLFGAQPLLAEPIDVNTASAEELAQLKGVGPAKARAIIATVTSNGPSWAVGELNQVRGLGAEVLRRKG
ncbi:ComEA family DNA-binding protein [Thiohalobacter thiocyanaticus]|uniref:Helix-hairpin-helix domain-containing protein n=1 Tax=Thiohalobacter thiocyanaticus TaxID=585455 RepID=A0A426QMQ7_9GAMM|nr:helix-hairpin-helix domain-containing protein [Thiohalobacter thiocyanaticus]RRQ22956.1 helix-hairpin-helix domain-containing protein [Thiohalobacter thiocyanaticus]